MAFSLVVHGVGTHADTAVRAGRGSSVGCAFAWNGDGRGFDPHVRQHSFMAFGREIISTAILSLP